MASSLSQPVAVTRMFLCNGQEIAHSLLPQRLAPCDGL